MKDNHKPQAQAWLKQLEIERGNKTLSMGKLVKTLPTTATVLAADPEQQSAFVRHVVEVFGKLGARKKKIPSGSAWFHKNNVPLASEEVARLLLRRRLPLTDDALAEMLEQIAGMDFVTFGPGVEQLIGLLEKRAAEGPILKRLQKAASRVADGLLVKDWREEDADEWGLPRAADRKLAGRIERLLAGPLELGNG
jgi:hypothetical protein